MKALQATAPGSARRLSRILGEGSSSAGDLRAGTGRGSSAKARLTRIHRLLLLTAQAQSLHRNYQQRRTVRPEIGADVMGALERLSDSLSEASASLLGLVPQITLETEMPASSVVRLGADDGGAKSELRRTVTVSLANVGAQSVELVKIGLDVASLPSGVTCEPSDPVFFGALRPGQTVRATFQLRVPAESELPDNLCVGEVSYFAASASAHLRARPW